MECHKGGCNVQFFCGGADRDHKCERALTFCAGQLIADKADVNSSCMGSLNVLNECAQNITVSNLSAVSLVANDVCIPGSLKVSNFLNASKYRATVSSAADFSYSLSSFIPFSVALDDPNLNVSFGPFGYTAPVAGYYSFMLKLISNNLVPSNGIILGAPIADPQIYVNGVLASEMYAPFLSFLNQQKTILSGLLSLKAGDLVQAKYKVYSFDPVNGLIEVAGTTNMVANGSDINSSEFKIHLLSVDNGSQIPCSPVVPCLPCTPLQCDPSQDCDMNGMSSK